MQEYERPEHVLIFNMVSVNKYNSQNKSSLGVLINFRSVKEPWNQKFENHYLEIAIQIVDFIQLI